MGYIKEVALFFRSEHSKWSQICTMPRNLSVRPATFCLIGGPQNWRRILLWGIAMSPRSSIAIAQHFFLMACPNKQIPWDISVNLLHKHRTLTLAPHFFTTKSSLIGSNEQCLFLFSTILCLFDCLFSVDECCLPLALTYVYLNAVFSSCWPFPSV